ncbi:brachyurin-like [Anabrus simplex]|uniref:brachyurin-like n=1 Tax=Anabrus simplex TaxID=316456 RepID=UPI0035A3B088
MATTAVIFLSVLAAIQASTKIGVDVSSLTPRLQRVPVLKDAPTRPQGRITEGKTANRTDFPHQAALVLDTSGFCGGSLISSEWILTAAHCAQGVGRFTIYLGTLHITQPENGFEVLSSTTKIVHAGYSSTTFHNDVALIRLPMSVSKTKFISPVKLPFKNQTDDFVGKVAKASGWGRTSDSVQDISDVLKYTELTVITNSDCQEVFNKEMIRSSVLCTRGKGGQNVCNGDSGGALVIPTSEGSLQIGIVSFGAVNSCSAYPAAFARVTSFLPWIMANTDLDPSKQ